MRNELKAAIAASALLDLGGCAERTAVKVAPAITPTVSATASSPTPTPPATSSRPRLDEAAIFARLQPALTACYEQGKKSVSTMLDGRLTLNTTIDPSGKPTCVIVTDDTGLTQEVEDCMAARFAAEHFDGAAPQASVRVAVAAGKLTLGTRSRETSGIESVETFRMPDAFDVLESLVPEVEACIRGVDRTSSVRSLIVGARVGTNGKTQCALAIGSPEPLPATAAECSENVFRRASFPPPKGGPGLILVPMTLVRR